MQRRIHRRLRGGHHDRRLARLQVPPAGVQRHAAAADACAWQTL